MELDSFENFPLLNITDQTMLAREIFKKNPTPNSVVGGMTNILEDITIACLDLFEGEPEEWRALFLTCAEAGRERTVAYLIKKRGVRAYINIALVLAARAGHLEIVKLLIENGADVHALDDYALRMAAGRGYLKVVKFLVEKGADIHVNNDCPLGIAATRGDLEIVKYLVSKGANIHARDGNAFRWAAMEGNLQVVKFLVEHGANIHAVGDYVLRQAAKYGQDEVVKFLVSQGNMWQRMTMRFVLLREKIVDYLKGK